MPYTQHDALYLLSCLGAVERLQIVAPGASHRVNPHLQNVKIGLPMLRPRVLALGPDTCADSYGFEPDDISAFMIKHPTVLSRIRELRIMVRENWFSWWDTHGMTGTASNLAAAVGCTLETLELVVNCDHPDLFMDVVEPQMSLARCTALRSIKFTLHVDDQTPRGFGELLRMLVPLLCSFRLTASTAPAFSSLSFDVSITDFGSPSGDSLGYVLTEEDSDVLGNNSLDFTLVYMLETYDLGRIYGEPSARPGDSPRHHRRPTLNDGSERLFPLRTLGSIPLNANPPFVRALDA
ncbi:hypothetical protein PHLGIDRAFT_117660 [Phlebiopsis gigantea 11061_1 CR5-6]|uniref:Uncharacterized protein n=1 Tax=Phlebiopsis gigantea (strain 11061_1 CR5-6) TaxID=745531 RepID=A0A0C3RZN8_PHLG1|nr:hypothetical protein PHLGIDRAFT_117660 [Phlebiopsis gigantea 11061_1 CR5-6]